MGHPPQEVSPLSLNRLSLYLRCLRQLRDRGVTRISSQQLAQQFHLSAALIRKDLAQFGEFGIRGIGYQVEPLIETISAVLGLDREHRIAVVGMGRLGHALARYLGFNEGAFRIVAAFDSDRRKVGKKVGHLEIHHIGELTKVIGKTRAEMAILTSPAHAAQKVYEDLTAAGIRAVLNFAPTQLSVKPGIPTKSVDVRIHLEELAFFLRQ